MDNCHLSPPTQATLQDHHQPSLGSLGKKKKKPPKPLSCFSFLPRRQELRGKWWSQDGHPGSRSSVPWGYRSILVALKAAWFLLLISHTCLRSRWSSPGIPAALPLV